MPVTIARAPRAALGSGEGWWGRDQPDSEAQENALQTCRELVKRYARDQAFHTQACIAFYEAEAQPSVASTIFHRDMGGSQYNVIQSCVDTKVSHLIRQKQRMFFLTSKGNRKERVRALKMTQAVEANEEACGLNGSEGTQIVRDGVRDGTGCAKVVCDFANHRVTVERILREDTFVDERDARMGKPRQLMHRQRIDRAKLAGMFPDSRKEIEEAPAVDWSTDFTDLNDQLNTAVNDGTIAEQVEVYEIWHLPSVYVDGAKREEWEEGSTHDGRHMILIQGCEGPVALRDKPWPLPRFPIVFFRPNPRPIGIDGLGVVARRRHLQVRINRMLRRIDSIMDLHSLFTIYLNRAANVNPQHVAQNSLGRIIEGDMPPGQAIQHLSPQAVPGDYIQQVDKLVAWAFQAEGLSELTVHAERPKSFQSGEAVRTLLDTESVRHTDMFRELETFRLDLARVEVDMFRLMAWYDEDFELVWGDSKDLKRLKWREIDLEDTKWKLRAFPTNLLPSQPGAKLERANEMLEKGAIDREQWAKLLDFPDIQALSGDVTAAQDNIDHRLDRCEADDGDYADYMPHGFMNLPMAYKSALQRLNELESEEAEDGVVDRIQQWLEDCLALMNDAKPKPSSNAQPQQAPGGAPAPATPPSPGAPPASTAAPAPLPPS